MGEGDKPGEGDKSGFQTPKASGSVSKSADKKFGAKESKVSASKSVPKSSSSKDGAEAKDAGGAAKKKGASKKLSLGPAYKKEGEFEVWTNKEGSDDKTFVSVLAGKGSIEALSASVDLAKKSAKVTVIDASVEGSVVHAQVDLVDKIKHLLFGDDKKPAPPPAPTSPMAARMGDLTMHLGPLAPGPGSSNVFIGGSPAWRVGLDVHLCPAPGSPHGPGPTSPGALTVLINGAPAARATDFVVEPAGGPDVIAVGCPTVLIGVVTPPPPAGPPPAGSDDPPWVKFESVAKGDLGKVEGKLDVGIEGSLSERSLKAGAEGEVFAAVLKGELPLKMRVRIPFTSYYVGLGVKVEGSLLSAGAGANADATFNKGDTLFEASAGAKAGVGIGGVGAKLSLDVAK